ncbi:argininosuccinate lyase [candidate division WOR-1 bacterium RIFOXYA12_FULL_43_27]|uniref:Argininosuccinate lyase n=1 Tax=candidate division WOR-1 bacterium RIFOXYC2_FULL_46_14 TaxID=1802587 RepID=A0A1F4U4S4_UNCSA|nr:MAG: argininosuccinate lyase [candidate division WOR-1 bacterium RIFOXYA12_FULL_43_27]OGC20702.1 MAG: argininosuccinate lyase [candidate division WOR-1 bacterium RIFOXYB2_FULL_46_45]OGC31561.1 MAG: argininosuccinate lyase [candidate division WOR-1 bacterium RIFOXYA2_FULL_46_56]OGC39968.1 MAG: argininosuccinate lyase [candidate division WOR-1 bacterium RIFOXYC2_FULL_46_14]
MAAKPWSGRFAKATAKSVEEFTASIDVDKRLYKEDIVQSMAYARALLKAKILSPAECKKTIKGLEEILKGIDSKKITFKKEYEDVHMNIETILISKIGDTGKKLHTGRSRNDQVATDLRMYLKWRAIEIISLITNLQSVIIDLAEANINQIMPGYTHLQRAQPVSFAHYLMAYYEMLERDKGRFTRAHQNADSLPLGSGALAGTFFPIDRKFLAKELGFSKICQNSIDAVSDRDFVLDSAYAASVLMMHLSRLSEELVIFSSFEFDFIEISDDFCTGSSLMPQKKNPDVAELTRGKTGRVYGELMSLLTLLKAQPLAYNRDMQEDKEAIFDALDTVSACLSVYIEMMREIKVNKAVMEKAIKKGFLTATDLVYYLVNKGIPFRDAHHIIGKIVAYCEDSNMELEYISLTELKKFSDKFGYDVQRILSCEASVNAKTVIGGTSPERIKEAVKHARANLLHAQA